MDADDYIKAMKSYYDRRTPWHDSFMSYTDATSFARKAEPILSCLDSLVAERSIIEIACGTGSWTALLARRAASVFGLDSSERSLDIARKKTSDCNNVTLVPADVYHLDDSLGTFDTAFIAHFLSHVPRSRIPDFLDGVHARLGEAGSVAIVELTPTGELQREFRCFDDENNRICDRELPDGSRHQVIKNFFEEEELRRHLGDAALEFSWIDFPELNCWLATYRVNSG